VVADDRPGLLSFISAALVVNSMDVGAAQAFTRTRGETPEAVDFFWLHRDSGLPSPVLGGDAARIGEVMRSLITGTATIDDVVREARARRTQPALGATRITFDDAPDAGLSVLTIETFDRPGLLLAITSALHRVRVQIIASEATTEKGRVVDRFTVVELDGAPVGRQRRGLLQMEVLAAVESLTTR
jgi:[protein-PII] uridylyltransferase